MIRLRDLISENKNIKYNIYQDMDGCLTDFDKAYYELTGTKSHIATDKLSKPDFWKPISDAGKDWWANMEWMPDGKKLWNYIKKYNPTLLSSPSKEKTSAEGKKIWVKRELSNTPLILARSFEKKKWATPTSILIDDRESNIKDWRLKDGIGILHKSASDTIKQLKQLGL